MRLSLTLVAILAVISIATDYYIFKTIKSRIVTHRKAALRTHTVFAAISLVTILTVLIIPHRTASDPLLVAKMWALYTFFTIYIPKITFIIIDLIARIPQLFHRGKLRFVSIAGMMVSVVMFMLMWWGATINRFNIDITEETVEIQDLPEAFDGFKIVQISDLHLGTYNNDTTYISQVVNAVNEANPSLVVFTGDFVNRKASELKPFVHTLSRIKADNGCISILGNHDYGDYVTWKTPQDKAANRQMLLDMQKEMGWRILLDQTEYIHRGNDSIANICVENIGDPPFPTYGSLEKAYPDINDSVVKVLLSHNPAHWVNDICDKNTNIALTLAGHTHAMQMELFGVSPSALKYKTWGGMYTDGKGQCLYVNIGIGTVLIPTRIGATPEITVFTLRKK